MGSSKFLRVEDAAALIGVSPRTIYRYAKKGLFEAKCEGRSLLVAEEDIPKLKKGRRDILASPVNQDVIARMRSEMQTMRTQLAMVMRILNVRYEPLAFSMPEYELLYKAAEQLSSEGWPPQAEEMWADYFVRLKIEDIEGLEKATSDKHPWRPILRLATTMHLSPYNKDLSDVLAAGRSNVEHVAGVWCVLREESPRTFDVLSERDAAPLKKLVRRIQRAQS